jgi:hypothetical protein
MKQAHYRTPGFILQLDCPDLAMERHLHFADASLEEFRRHIQQNAETLNYALTNIPAEQARVHVCWGLQIQSWTEVARTFWLVIDVYRRTLDKRHNKEESDAKGNQSVGDVPTQNIYLSSPRIAENGSHHEGE